MPFDSLSRSTASIFSQCSECPVMRERGDRGEGNAFMGGGVRGACQGVMEGAGVREGERDLGGEGEKGKGEGCSVVMEEEE